MKDFENLNINEEVEEKKGSKSAQPANGRGKSKKSGHVRQNAFTELNLPPSMQEDDDGGEHEEENEKDGITPEQFQEWLGNTWEFLYDLDKSRVEQGKQNTLSVNGMIALEQSKKIKELQGKEEDPKRKQEREEIQKNNEKGKNYKPRPTLVRYDLEADLKKKKEADIALREKLKNEYNDYKIETTNRADLLKNADAIARAYKRLDKNDHWYRGSSPQYRELKEAMKTLRDLAYRMAAESKETGKGAWERRKHTQTLYLECTQKVKELSEKYLSYKTDNINSKYAQARFDTVTDLKNIIQVNDESVFKAFSRDAVRRFEGQQGERKRALRVEPEMKKIEAFKKMADLHDFDISKASDRARKLFLGDHFTLEQIKAKDSHCHYSLGRMGGVSVTIMALLAEQKDGKPLYSAEDILNPDKLQKEKADMFKTVVDKMTQEPADQKWIAQKMYDGYMVAYDQMGIFASKVNYDNPDFIYQPDFFKAGKLSMVMFDVWQEMEHCKNELTEYAKTKDPSVGDFNKLHSELGNKRGLMDKYMKMLIDRADYIMGKDKDYADYGNQVLKHSFNVMHFTKLFSERAKTAGDKHISNWFSEGKMAMARAVEGGTVEAFGNALLSHQDVQRMLPDIVDFGIFKNIEVEHEIDEFGNVKANLKGDFGMDILKEDQNYISMGPQEVYNRINSQLEHLADLSKVSEHDVQPYLQKAIKGLTKLGKLSVKARTLSPEEKQESAAAMKDVFSYYLADNFSSVGAKGEDLKTLVDQNIDKLECYKRYVNHIDDGSTASLVISNQSTVVDNDPEVILAKGRYAKKMLESGAYKTDGQVKEGFAYAYTSSVMDAAGKLPRSQEYHRKFKVGEHVEHVVSHIGEYLSKDAIKQYKKPRGPKPDLLTNTQNLKNYAENYGKKQPGMQAGK
ncbi:MAG: hypothetical protein K6E18_06780 [Lachnospiraceae bacterium]|nr:hypothetical protein [Lachnospiraceae bacterium]